MPHPDDYRALHPTLLLDLYGDLLHQYAAYPGVPDLADRLDETRVAEVADLRAELVRARADWEAFHDRMADGLFGAVRRMGRFTLSRFLPNFDSARGNHLGETITDETGRLSYLKTFRLSAAQTRRGYLLATGAVQPERLQILARPPRLPIVRLDHPASSGERSCACWIVPATVRAAPTRASPWPRSSSRSRSSAL